MAVQLRHRGRTVAGVAMIDCPAPLSGAQVPDKTLLDWFLEDLALDLPVAQLTASIDATGMEARQQLEQVAQALQASGRELVLDLEQLTAIYRVFLGIVRGSRRYAGSPINADVLLLRANDGIVSEFAGHPQSHRPDWGWRAFTTGNVDTKFFTGTHYTLLSEVSVAGVARTIEGWLRTREK